MNLSKRNYFLVALFCPYIIGKKSRAYKLTLLKQRYFLFYFILQQHYLQKEKKNIYIYTVHYPT